MTARAWPSLLVLIALESAARATSPFDSPITPELIDQRATAEWVDGHETSRADFLDPYNKPHWPNQVTWFLVMPRARPGHNGIVFGSSKRPGPRHLRVGITKPIPVGTVLTRGNIDRLSVLRGDAPYPGDLGNDAQWTEAVHQSGRDVSLWVLPPGTSTRALRFTVATVGPDGPATGYLTGAAVVPERIVNLAPEALVLASSHQATAGRLTDGGYNQWDAWDNDDGSRTQPISATRPEWVMLLWDHPVSLRGLCAIWPVFGKAEVQTYTGPPRIHPREANDAQWRTLAKADLAHHYPQTLVPNWIDFGRAVATQAIRVRFVAPADESGHYLKGQTHDGKRGWLGELLALTSLGSAPVPAPPPPWRDSSHPPIAVPFTMPDAGYATIVIEDAQGRRVRNLVGDTWFTAGPQTAWWDGLDESGRLDGPFAGIYTMIGAPVTPGTYAVRGLFHGPIDLRYELSVYSPGTPPWMSGSDGERGAGGWLADHSNPTAVLSLPGTPPRVLLASPIAEAGHGIIWTDLDGRKLDGRRWIGGTWTGASHLARDDGPKPVAGVYAYAGVAWQGELRLTALHDDGSFTPVLPPKSPDVVTTEIRGLAAWNGVLVAALPKDHVVFVDVAKGCALGTAALSDGRGLAFDRTGRLLALSGKRLLVFSNVLAPTLGAARVLIAGGLDDPRALTTDAANNIYVADWGTHQIKVFDAEGRRLRVIGRPGGAVVGPYDPERMHRPAGLTITPDGHLWVAEDSWAPKRVSVWTTSGAFVKAFYGPPQYGGGGALDPRDRARFYYAGQGQNTGLEFALDWKTGGSTLRSIYWLGAADPAAPPVDTAPESAIYVGGHQYMTNIFNSRPVGGPWYGGLWMMRAGRAQQVASFGHAGSWELLKTAAFRARWPAGIDPDHPSTPPIPVIYAWSDLNADGRVTPDEVTMARGNLGSVTIDERLELCTAGAIVLAPEGFTAAGVPRYNATHGHPQAGDFFLKEVTSGSGQVRALRDGWTFSSGGPVRGFRGGTQVWTYPNEWPSQQAGVFSTPPTRAGQLMATARMLADTVTPHTGDAGEIVALNGDKGDVFLMTADGLFVSTLFHDVRDAASAWNMPSATRGMKLNDVSLHEEAFWTNLSQTSDGKVYVIAGQNHSSVVRVDGLDTARRLAAASVIVTPALAEEARLYRTRTEQERQQRVGRDLMTIALRRAPIAVDGDLGEWRDATWVVVDERAGRLGAQLGRVEAAAAISGERLYLAFRSQDRTFLGNTGESTQMLFATGGALDLMLGTNASADPRRGAPVAGDLRLIVTRVNGKPRAVLYRPKANGPHRPPVAFSSPWRTVLMDEVRDVTALVELAQHEGNYEVSVPLATLGLTPRDGLELRGDIGILRGDGARTVQRLYWQNKATSTVSDIPTEATLTPQLWGRLRFVAEPRR